MEKILYLLKNIKYTNTFYARRIFFQVFFLRLKMKIAHVVKTFFSIRKYHEFHSERN